MFAFNPTHTFKSWHVGRAALALLTALIMWAGWAGPVQAAPAARLQCAQTHVVARGENLYRIGLRYNVSVRTLQEWNRISNPNRIYVGQKLCVSLHSPTPPADDTVAPTDIELIHALRTVNIRRGPGMNHAVIGRLFAGMQARVTGISRNGQWWRVLCPDDSAGSCWVSAQPSLTEPITGPGEGSGWHSTAIIESIQVQVRESYPVQVVAVVRGHLPDGCTYINRFRQLREGNTIRIQFETGRNPGFCTQALVPFTETITLDVQDWYSGLYSVRVDNVRTDFYLP